MTTVLRASRFRMANAMVFEGKAWAERLHSTSIVPSSNAAFVAVLRSQACVLLCGLLLLSAGCVDSKNPISDPQASVVDEDLLGFWYSKREQSETVHLIARTNFPEDIFPNSPRGLMTWGALGTSDGVNQPFGDDGDLTLAFTSRIGRDTFLNTIKVQQAFQEFKGNETNVLLWKPTGEFRFAHYEVIGDTLRVIHCSTQGAAELVDAGELKGKVERNEDNQVTQVTLTSSTDELAAVISGRQRDKLFPPTDMETWRRVR